MNNVLFWKSFQKDQIPGLLMGLTQEPQVVSASTEPNYYLVNAGFSDTNDSSCILKINDNDATDFFSWVNTYASAVFPVSQTKRILVESDYALLKLERTKEVTQTSSDRWSSIILGEILAQGDESKDIEEIPISRHNACFSTTYARTLLTYATTQASKDCIIRLKILERDNRFITRQITLEEIIPCWRYLDQSEDRPSYESIAYEFGTKVFSDAKNDIYASLAKFYLPKMLDSSIEKRVIAFNSLVIDTTDHLYPNRASIAALLGAAAFLVGRSTSHIALLRKAAKSYPSAFLWFGTLAALVGPESWDTKWARAVRSIDRFVGDAFNVTDPVSADLCWAEYQWLSLSDDRPNTYNDIPKLYSRLLSIEVLPGANCQLRLSSEFPLKSTNITSGSETYTEEHVTPKALNIEQSVDDLISLAIKLKTQIQNSSYVNQQPQKTLFSTEENFEKITHNRTPRKPSNRTKK